MSKLMLINVTHAEESRVGIITNGVLSAFEIESFSREHLKGNIYRGVVHRIHPALEAAFVDIGAERDAFLPLDEICFRNLPNPPERTNGAEGRRGVRIQELLSPGDEILVQIVKEEFGNKPPTLSTYFSLPGRYLVLLPGSDDAGISRRIEGDERQRIREIISEISPPEGFGIIVRTVAGIDQGTRELQRDLSYLLRLWDSIQQTAKQRRAPALVYREHDLVLRNIRDYFTADVDEIWVDNEEVFERAREFLREVMPDKVEVLRLYDGDKPIFSHFDVETQIESVYKRRVSLRSGGSIVIDGTEALTAIDVNSGRSTRGSNQEETAFRTNREAAVEIARQLRLRDVGGLIVIDFIDMRNSQHIAEVERTLRQAMYEDKARHEVGRISQFGLLEVSRQRLRPAAAATSYLSCPMCEGYGLVRTTESAALVGLRKIHNRIAKGDVASMRAVFPSEVGLYLLNQKRDDLAVLERRYATRIQVAFSDHLMPHQFESEVRLRSELEQQQQQPLRLGGIAAAEPADARRSGRRRSTPQRSDDRARQRPAPRAAEAEGADAAPRESRREAARDARREAPRDSGRRTAERDEASRPAETADAATPAEAGEGGARRPRRRRGRRRGRGTGTQAAIALADALLAIAASSPWLAERIVAASADAELPDLDVELGADDEAADGDEADVAREEFGTEAAPADVGDAHDVSPDDQGDAHATAAATTPETASGASEESPAEPAEVAAEAATAAPTGAGRRKRSTRSRAEGAQAGGESAAARPKKTASKRKKKTATATKKRATRKKSTSGAADSSGEPRPSD